MRSNKISTLARDLDGQISAHQGLTPKTGFIRAPVKHSEKVEFVLFGFAGVGGPFNNDAVAGGATAVAATDVIERKAEVHGEIEHRTGLAMTAIGESTDFKFVNRTVVKKGELGHLPNGIRGTARVAIARKQIATNGEQKEI
jgi:hypothetical protein